MVMPRLFYVPLSVFVLMEQKFHVTHRYTVLKETEKNLTDH